jgi:GNAT superfamily N-acetyltransferase
MAPALAIHPATPDRWPDVERLFGQRGACAGCWCQWWKQSQREFDERKGAANRRAMRRSVEGGEVPGLLAYAGEEPVGWVAVQPRSAYARLARPRTLVAVDDRPVWSVTCFFVARGWRGKGLMSRLLEAAAAHARAHGAPALEGYPIDSKAEQGAAFVYPGVYSTFVKSGFREVARKARTRPVVRLELRREPASRARRR